MKSIFKTFLTLTSLIAYAHIEAAAPKAKRMPLTPIAQTSKQIPKALSPAVIIKLTSTKEYKVQVEQPKKAHCKGTVNVDGLKTGSKKEHTKVHVEQVKTPKIEYPVVTRAQKMPLLLEIQKKMRTHMLNDFKGSWQDRMNAEIAIINQSLYDLRCFNKTTLNVSLDAFDNELNQALWLYRTEYHLPDIDANRSQSAISRVFMGILKLVNSKIPKK